MILDFDRDNGRTNERSTAAVVLAMQEITKPQRDREARGNNIVQECEHHVKLPEPELDGPIKCPHSTSLRFSAFGLSVWSFGPCSLFLFINPYKKGGGSWFLLRHWRLIDFFRFFFFDAHLTQPNGGVLCVALRGESIPYTYTIWAEAAPLH